MSQRSNCSACVMLRIGFRMYWDKSMTSQRLPFIYQEITHAESENKTLQTADKIQFWKASFDPLLFELISICISRDFRLQRAKSMQCLPRLVEWRYWGPRSMDIRFWRGTVLFIFIVKSDSWVVAHPFPRDLYGYTDWPVGGKWLYGDVWRSQ